MRRIVAVMAFVALGCTACAAPSGGTASPSPVNLGIANGTTLTVTLFVNDLRVGDYAPQGGTPRIGSASLTPLPWAVEARSRSGRVLTSMHVVAGAVQTTVYASDHTESSGVMGRVDLSCGRLTIWAGDVIPSGPIPSSPSGTPGDCEP
jgi:hypothetical protein